MVGEKKKYLPKPENLWIFCGTKSDKEAIKYSVQVLFGFTLVSFSIGQIVRDVPNKEVYFSLISSIFGYFLPSPGQIYAGSYNQKKVIKNENIVKNGVDVEYEIELEPRIDV
jgi:hypothetical protein